MSPELFFFAKCCKANNFLSYVCWLIVVSCCLYGMLVGFFFPLALGMREENNSVAKQALLN